MGRTWEKWAWSVSADARWPALAGYSSASAVQACYVTVHCCLQHRAPRYLADYCVPVSEVAGRQHLWSARCHQLSVPRVRRSTFGIRAFSVAAPRVCNSLPDHLGVQLLIPNNLGENWRRICSLDIRSVSALVVLRNYALQIDIYLLTCLFNHKLKSALKCTVWLQCTPVPDRQTDEHHGNSATIRSNERIAR